MGVFHALITTAANASAPSTALPADAGRYGTSSWMVATAFAPA